MMPKGLVTQIGMLAVSIGIIFTYVEPAFTEIAKMQDTIVTYQTEIAKVSEVNKELDSLVDRMKSVSVVDQERLTAYMPDTVDVISVQRDLLLITKQSGAFFESVQPGGTSDRSSRRGSKDTDDSKDPKPYLFELAAQGNYQQLKGLFSLLEQNKYPLEVHGVSLTKSDGGFLTASIKLVTYGQK